MLIPRHTDDEVSWLRKIRIVPVAAPPLLRPKDKKLPNFEHGDSNVVLGANSGGSGCILPSIFNNVFNE